MRNRAGRLIAATALTVAAAVGAVTGATPAFAGATPGTYSNWAFDGVSGLSDVAYTINVEQHPGQQSQIYWSNQVGWTNGHGGYAGMQTNADQTRNLFLFSVWDVSEAKVGSAGSWCQAFGGEGEGMSCRIWGKWTAGQTYKFHYQSEGGGWWGMTITNTATGEKFKLGSIKVGSDQMNPTSVSWVEYYRWSDARADCTTEPYSRAVFGLPKGNNGSLTARVSSTKVNGCPGYPSNGATVTTGSYGARHTLDIGNSVMGPITGLAGKCADISGSNVVLYGCHGGANQQWVLSYDGTIRSKGFTCLDAGGNGNLAAVKSTNCDGGTRQQWRVQTNKTLLNPASGKCLDVESGASADGTRLVLYTCHGGANQQWTTPVRPAN